jgi:hypothetical protein
MDALLFSLTSRSARNQRLGMVCFQDCRHQFPFYSTDSLHDFWGIRGSRLWMSDDAEKLHFQGMGSQCMEGRQAFDSPSSTHFCCVYMQLKGNILKNYTVALIFNAQSQLGTFIFPSRTPHSSPLKPHHPLFSPTSNTYPRPLPPHIFLQLPRQRISPHK